MRKVTLSLLSSVAIMLTSLSFFQNCDGFHRIESDSRNISSYSGSASSENIRSSSSLSATSISLFRRLAGVTPDIDDPEIAEMEEYLLQGDAFSAAAIAANTPEFYNITVRDFAAKMSNIEQTVDTPLNDFIATIIGSVRDDVPATDLLTQSYFYRAYNVQGVSDDLSNSIIRSNNHYLQLENVNANLSEVLEREEEQKVLSPSGGVEVLRDPAGLMTTRGWMAAHGNGGTNRRLVEYAFKIFLCSPIETWASTSNADNRVGPDVGRLPASQYLNKCKSCHSGMDALRPATAHFDFADGFIKYRYTYTQDPNPDNPAQLNVPVPASEQLVPYKFRRASDTFPEGYRVNNDTWFNYTNSSRFGWRSRPDGSGMRSFGELIAHSEQFSRCMAKRVFKSVCRRDPEDSEKDLIRDLASDFENDNYQLRNLFINVALQPQCIGLDL